MARKVAPTHRRRAVIPTPTMSEKKKAGKGKDRAKGRGRGAAFMAPVTPSRAPRDGVAVTAVWWRLLRRGP